MRLIILMVFLLSACGGEDVQKKEFDRTGRPQKITVYLHQSQQEMEKAYRKIGKRGSPEKMGWAGWDKKESVGCEVHLVKASTNATWGHEFKHCIYGQYHK